MSEKPIAVGDLVQVVRGCGCYGGIPFKVGKIDGPWKFYCAICKQKTTGMLAEKDGCVAGSLCVQPVSYLRRIPPLDELESVQTDEKVTEKVSA